MRSYVAFTGKDKYLSILVNDSNDQELEAAEQVADTEVKQAEKAKKLMLSEKAVSQESITVGRKLKSR